MESTASHAATPCPLHAAQLLPCLLGDILPVLLLVVLLIIFLFCVLFFAYTHTLAQVETQCARWLSHIRNPTMVFVHWRRAFEALPHLKHHLGGLPISGKYLPTALASQLP